MPEPKHDCPLTVDDPVTIGWVGCGGISHVHMKGLELHPELRVVAGVDVDLARAKDWCGQYDVGQSFEDWREMIEQVQPEVVVFTTWPVQHHEQVIGAAELGVPAVLSEKSFSMTGEEADAMLEVCKTLGTVVMEAFMYRHMPRTRDFLERVHSGDFGAVRSANASFSNFFYNPQGDNWRNRRETGGGIVYDFTCYSVNVLRAVFGRRPLRVIATGETCPVQNIIITLHGLLDYGDGVVARVESSQKSTFRMDCEVVLEQGVLTLPQFLMNRHRADGGALPWHETTGTWVESQETVDVPTQFENPYGLQMVNLARQLREGAASGMPVEETCDNMHTIDALVRSYEEDCWVEVGA